MWRNDWKTSYTLSPAYDALKCSQDGKEYLKFDHWYIMRLLLFLTLVQWVYHSTNFVPPRTIHQGNTMIYGYIAQIKTHAHMIYLPLQSFLGMTCWHVLLSGKFWWIFNSYAFSWILYLLDINWNGHYPILRIYQISLQIDIGNFRGFKSHFLYHGPRRLIILKFNN